MITSHLSLLFSVLCSTLRFLLLLLPLFSVAPLLFSPVSIPLPAAFVVSPPAYPHALWSLAVSLLSSRSSRLDSFRLFRLPLLFDSSLFSRSPAPLPSALPLSLISAPSPSRSRWPRAHMH